MVISEDEIMKLHRIRKKVMEMLRDRNYLVADFKLNMSKKDFKEKYGENVKREDFVIKKAKKDNPSDQSYVFFQENDKVDVHTLRTYTKRMNSENVYRASFQTNFTEAARDNITKIDSKFHLEVFQVFSEDEITKLYRIRKTVMDDFDRIYDMFDLSRILRNIVLEIPGSSFHGSPLIKNENKREEII